MPLNLVVCVLICQFSGLALYFLATDKLSDIFIHSFFKKEIYRLLSEKNIDISIETFFFARHFSYFSVIIIYLIFFPFLFFPLFYKF